MGMEINGNSGRPRPTDLQSSKSQASGSTAGATRGGSPGKTASPGGDQVRFSNQAAQLQALETQISNLPVVDTQRVQEVQRTSPGGEGIA